MHPWLAAAMVLAGAPADLPDSPYLHPRFHTLMEAVTFHVSFDADSMVPDMAEGPKFAPRLMGTRAGKRPQPQFADGVVGRAMVLGSGGASYPRAGNVLLERRGAMAMWVKPLEWRRPNGSNVVFITAGGAFIVERQGPLRGKDNKILRHEHVFALAKATRNQTHYTCVYGGGAWENGRWYLLVVNWSWPRMEVSVDGGAFAGKSLPGRPDKKLFGQFGIGTPGGDKALMDEVMAFRRPLTREEAQLLYSVKKSARAR